MTLDEEIAWWTRLITRNDELGFLAFGMATGLKWAKRYYGAQQEDREGDLGSVPL